MGRFAQRALLFLLVIAFGTWLFYIGREHKVFLDNKTIEMEGTSYRALKNVKITVGEHEPVELLPRDRDLVRVAGPSFKVKVEVMDDFGETVEKTIERELKPGFSRDMMLSMPLLNAERPDYILPAPTVKPVSEQDDAPVSTDAELPGASIP